MTTRKVNAYGQVKICKGWISDDYVEVSILGVKHLKITPITLFDANCKPISSTTQVVRITKERNIIIPKPMRVRSQISPGDILELVINIDGSLELKGID